MAHLDPTPSRAARASRRRGSAAFAAALALAAAPPASGQSVVPGAPLSARWDWTRCTDVIAPASRSFALVPRPAGVELAQVRAAVSILEQTASTTLELELVNHGAQPAEAIVLLPVPDGAAVSAFAIEGAAPEATAQLLPREEARRLYDQIVAKLRDPGLLEFAGHAAVRSSVFPVPARGRQRVRLTYEHLLARDGDRVDYVLPRSESLEGRVPWTIDVSIRSQAGVALVYSPSHELETRRVAPGAVNARVAAGANANPGPLRLSWLLQRAELAASLFAYPDPRIGGGYFLLMAGLPAPDPAARRGVNRELTVVLDRSGSMAGAKWDQARAAALQVLEGLDDGESFNLIDYSTTVSLFATAPVRKDASTRRALHDYLASLRPMGGTNIHDALVEALGQPRSEGTLPIVLFLTDGLPTVRATSEAVLRDLVERGNPHQRRVFTFGVGTDVNAPLLDRIADVTRATATYVLPGEDVELAVARVWRKLDGPLLSDVRLATLDAAGAPDPRRVRELQPAALPDLFDGDSLIVLGQYAGSAPLRFEVGGRHLGAPRTFRFEVDVARATTRNAFVPRLWATRRIAYLVDQVRAFGVEPPPLGGAPVAVDPRLRELTDEILRLSTEFGVLTEYTAFLATDGADFGDWRELTQRCGDLLAGRAVQERAGWGAVAQACNFNERKLQATVNARNAYFDAGAGADKLERVEIATVQQVADRCFFKNQGQWVDSRLIGAPAAAEALALPLIAFGTPEWWRLADELIADGRNALLLLRGEVVLDHRGTRLRVRNTE